MRKSYRVARALVAVPQAPLDDEARAVYERQAPCALAVARVLAVGEQAADQIVVDAFSALTRRPDAVGLDLERELTLASVVVCFRRWSRSQAGATLHDHRGAWGSLPDDHLVVVALSARGGCTLDQIAAIVGSSRDSVARRMREALWMIAREHATGPTAELESDSGAA